MLVFLFMQTYYELQNLSYGLMIQQYTIGKKQGQYICDSSLQTCLLSEQSQDKLELIKKHIPQKFKFDYFYFSDDGLSNNTKNTVDIFCQPKVQIFAEKSFLTLPQANDFNEKIAIFLLTTIKTPKTLAVVPNACYVGIQRKMKKILEILGNSNLFLTT